MERLLEFAQQSPTLSFAFVGLTLALVVTEVMRLFRGFKGVTPAQLTDLINRENALVVDLRAQPDFEKGHITGSRHQLPSQIDPEGKLLAKAKESPVVLVCAAGVTAAGTAEKLVKAGFKKVSVLDGGIGAWTSAGLPLAKGKA
ncbi:MAG TPA: rhodanese-like domain-containing protein [Arenimonas sp.]|uniref:rhodanese-like domain-containing protein n=1 Tax=Arenimonas sp. TaxID=1872635 RepID=UPI002D7F0ABE|nr:rhodanese-like domain-containing protein [Arenimonas sp.]HEU0154181.1 rhodanese-like domain-containing protein [Arenimonas sp.]